MRAPVHFFWVETTLGLQCCIRANKPPYQKGRDFKLIVPVPYPIYNSGTNESFVIDSTKQKVL